METIVKLKTADNHTINGTLNSVDSDTLIIFVHGLTGGQWEHHYLRAPEFFNPKGIDTFKFDFYSSEEEGRVFSETSVPVHSQDLTQVLKHFKDKYQKLILVGHSLGAPVILETNLEAVERIILWDPADGISSYDDIARKEGTYHEVGDYYTINNCGKEIIIGKPMIDSWIKASDTEYYASKITKPCKFIFAGQESKKKSWGPYIDQLTVEHDQVTIEGASHVFFEEGTLQKAYEEMHSWITK